MSTIFEVQRRLQELKDMGYVPSLRRGATGIGYTLEHYLGVGETNIQVPDLGGRVELKAVRRNSKSMITMFTFNRGAWKIRQVDVIRRYGYLDKNGRQALYCSLWTNTPNSLGFSISVDRTSNILALMQGTVEVASWSIYRLVGALLYKLGKVLLVMADSRKESGAIEEFLFNEAYLLDNPSEEDFVDAIENSRVCLDLRMHINDRGKVRNRGTAFRAKEKDLNLFFHRKRRLL